MGRSHVVGRSQLPSLCGRYATVLHPSNRHEIRPPAPDTILGTELNLLCPSLPPTTFILLPTLESVGFLLYGRQADWTDPNAKDDRYFGVVLWGSPRVVTAVPNGFRVGSDVVPVTDDVSGP